MLKLLLGGGPWPLLIVLGIGLAVGAGGAAWVQDYRIDGLRAERDSAERELKGARDDAQRWQAAAEQNAEIIRQQNDAIEAQRVDLRRASQVIADAVTAARQAEADAEAQINQWKERARANPDQAVPLGRIARDGVRLLLEP